MATTQPEPILLTKHFCGIRCTSEQYTVIKDFYLTNDFPSQSSLVLTALLSYANNGFNGNTTQVVLV